jgi:carboxymethylenebutenolidase
VRYGVDAAVVYHGGDTEKYLGEIDGLNTPLLIIWGRRTSSFPRQRKVANKPNTTVYSSPGQRHAFARHNGTHYNAAAAAVANERTSEFLNRQRR